jgi:glycosyltransferase involved in cell wall biosynthesis
VTNGSGVDLDHYADDPLTAASAPESIVFLLIARLLRDKGIVEYVDAARRLKGRYPGARFQLVGFFDVNPAALTRQEVDAWVREGVIEFAGETTDVRPFLRNCDVYVLPSYREGTPRTVLEAMATGRPVITTDAPGCRETVAIPGDRPARSASGVLEGLNGFLVPVRNSAALAEAMERFIVAPDLIATMGRYGRDYAEQRYDVHRVNDVVLSGMNLARTTARPAPAAACS